MCVFVCVCVRLSTNIASTQISLSVICVHTECRYTLKDNQHGRIATCRHAEPIKNQSYRVTSAVKPRQSQPEQLPLVGVDFIFLGKQKLYRAESSLRRVQSSTGSDAAPVPPSRRWSMPRFLDSGARVVCSAGTRRHLLSRTSHVSWGVHIVFWAVERVSVSAAKPIIISNVGNSHLKCRHTYCTSHTFLSEGSSIQFSLKFAVFLPVFP